MKKLLLSLVAVSALAFSTQAQTEKGKIMVGGNLEFNSITSDADGAKANTSFAVVPSAGYFVSDNFAIGTGVGYEYSKVIDNAEKQAFVVSPFGRYYANLSESFKFFGQLAVPLKFGTTKDVDASGDVGEKIGNSTSIGVALSPGFAFFPTPKVGIELSLNGLAYENFRQDDADGTNIKGQGYDAFSFGTNFFAPRLGVQFHF
jgi:hypothetical protein